METTGRGDWVPQFPNRCCAFLQHARRERIDGSNLCVRAKGLINLLDVFEVIYFGCEVG